MKKIWSLYQKSTWDKKILVGSGVLAVFPIVAGLLFSPTKAERPSDAHTMQVDTFIPKGFVLVPIEVQNYDSLDSILGNFAIVDLLQAKSPENSRQTLVARNVRLLRAPQNPAHFAILVPEGEVHSVLQNGASFTVVVKRPVKTGTEFVKDEVPTRRMITYERN